jgi:pyruvate-ferredoxin/flavodoxin oxidoreductase
LDSRAPTLPLEKYIYNETRYTMLAHSNPEAARRLLAEAQREVIRRWKFYEYLAAMPGPGPAQEAIQQAVKEQEPVGEAKHA